jgi:hypothetical protein
MSDELILVESPTMRARYRDRVDALDKVGALALADGVHATTQQVAHYFEVPVKTLESVIEDHRDELEHNGLRVLRGEELTLFKGASGITSRAASLLVFPRPAILNVGQLLTGSKVAEAVRRYLLTVEATATTEHRAAAVELARLQERQDYRSILHFLKLGGATGDDYRLVQNTLYVGLFGKTAQQIRATQPQRTGVARKRGEGFRKSTVAKDYLTEQQLEVLNSTVLATFAQIQLRHRDGTTPAQMIAAINAAVSLIRPRQIGAA